MYGRDGGRRGSEVPGRGSEGGAGADPARGVPGKQTRVAALAAQVRSPAAVRAVLAGEPDLAAELPAYFAEGNQDADLNELLGRAFPGAGPVADPSASHLVGSEPAGAVEEKGGTGAGAVLPAARSATRR